MIIDVSQILKDSYAAIAVDGDIDDIPEDSFSGVKIALPVRISGRITNNSGNLTLTAHVSCKAETVCARCLEAIELNIDFDIDEMLVQGNDQETYSDVYTLEKDSVDLTEIVIDNIFMNTSGKYLCSEDCKGLCPKCGANLNKTECGCDNDDIDPRWAALAEIMKNS